MEKHAEKYEVTFSIANARYLDGGSYWCLLEIFPQAQQYWSVGAYIQIREQIYSKPSIAVSPKELVPLGKNVAIHCKNKGNRLAEYSLIKEGALNIIQFKRVDRNGAVFTIDNVDQSKVGIYWCDYRPYRDYRYSHFSERVYINITDCSLSKPSLKITSTEQTSSGFNVTIECQGPEMGLIFSLHKSEDLKATQEETDRNATAFQVIMKELEDARHYTCQYCHKGNPFVWSELSDPLEQDRNDSITIIVWARIAAGYLILVFLLLLITCNLIRKRKKGKWTLYGLLNQE
nr:immunoglobulin superfamily member 1-like [Anolis sagrei ordinatus]